jgi:lysozyme
MSRTGLFDAIRPFAPEGRFNPSHVKIIDDLADLFGIPRDNGRTMSDAGVEALKGFEGVVLTAYPDPATNGDPWTIGVGHTGSDVRKGLTITAARATELLRADLARFETAVNRLAPKTTQGQFDALTSFAFNLGERNLASSTLLKMHNAGDYDGAAGQFGKWNKAAGKVMAGLTKRRAAEARMYKGLPA